MSRIEQADFLAAIVEFSNDAIISKDLDGRILSWNKAAEKMYGYSAGEAVGKSIYMLAPPEKKAEIDRLLDMIRRGEQTERLETVRLRKDGGKVEVSLTVSPVKDGEGRILGASVIAHDISGRKRLEAALQSTSKILEDLYNNAPCGYHSLDRDGVFVLINDTELKWLGYSREEVVGRLKITDVMDAKGVELNRKNFERFKETGFVRDLQFEMVRKDGTTFPVLLSATAVTDPEGGYLMSRSVVYDLTERKKTEDALNRAHLDLLEASAKVKVLSGLLPICASCKKIRNDKGFWDSIEKYIREHSEAEFTHSLCPDCARKLYPEFYEEREAESN